MWGLLVSGCEREKWVQKRDMKISGRYCGDRRIMVCFYGLYRSAWSLTVHHELERRKPKKCKKARSLRAFLLF